MKPGGAGAAHRPRPPDGTDQERAGDQLRRAGHDRGRHALVAFKKSLFAGVLDGGENEVFLHGTRFARFMESVDRVTGKMGEPAPAEPVAPADVAAAAGVPEPSTASDPWATLVDAGMKLVESLAAPRSGQGTEARTAPESWLETDSKTGRTFLKLPAPAPETLQHLAGALSPLLAGLRQR